MKPRLIMTNIYYLVAVKLKPENISGLNGILTHDLCNASIQTLDHVPLPISVHLYCLQLFWMINQSRAMKNTTK